VEARPRAPLRVAAKRVGGDFACLDDYGLLYWH
jgi:hypothetical protein